MGMVFCRGCGKEIHESAPTCPHCGAPQSVKSTTADTIPEGIKGWSWGAFLLGPIWAIGNNTWVGLLTLVPYIGFIMSFVLGFKGQEWAWKNKQWDSVEHFNRVQEKWSYWGGMFLVAVLIAGAIAIPVYLGYQRQADVTVTTGKTDKFAGLAAAIPAQLSPTGELAAMFNLISDNTNLQRENKFKEIKGKVVEWTLPVYEVAKDGDGYKVQTEPGDAVGAFVYITPRNVQDKAIIEALKTGNRISIKGVIEDDFMRHLVIKPAILFQPGSAKPVAIEVPQPVANQQSQAPAQSDALQVTPQATWKPSFDCTKASTFSENAICSDPLLGKLDGALSENYKHMLASDIGDGARNDLKTTQKKWLAERNKCTDNQCLIDAYRKRIDEVCEYPVISGMYPVCTNSDDVK